MPVPRRAGIITRYSGHPGPLLLTQHRHLVSSKKGMGGFSTTKEKEAVGRKDCNAGPTRSNARARVIHNGVRGNTYLRILEGCRGRRGRRGRQARQGPRELSSMPNGRRTPLIISTNTYIRKELINRKKTAN